MASASTSRRWRSDGDFDLHTKEGKIHGLDCGEDRVGLDSVFDRGAHNDSSQTQGICKSTEIDNHFSRSTTGGPTGARAPNICWGGARGTFDYDDWLPKCSYGRLFPDATRGPRSDWTNSKRSTGRALVLDLGNAWQLDYVMDLMTKTTCTHDAVHPVIT